MFSTKWSETIKSPPKLRSSISPARSSNSLADLIDLQPCFFRSRRRRGLMRILRSIVGTQSLLVQSREANFSKRRSVRSQLVGDDNRRNEALTSKQFPERTAAALSRWGWTRSRGSTARHIYTKYTFAVQQLSHHFVEMPPTVGSRPKLTQFLAIIGPNLKTHRWIDSLLTISPAQPGNATQHAG